eukprot:TRINITY_DN11808_c0_g1_i1.p1 TRINITY_DN11808_c0_g1~~TRINITY_DN11808_c0_g1_i1.p1  ORF type:complete len:375 (-),score=86.62 TRINITY_DN11808_c0_g1_i1:20-1144(-)
MLKPKHIDISLTNIANLGSDLDKKCREAAAGKEPAWKGCGLKEGLEKWRIENFRVVKCKPDGIFYKGDSYIVLKTRKTGNVCKHDIHFWLGENTTQDEAGTAAYKTVELDDYFHQEPIQHREVCYYESPAFQSYFANLQYREGGVDSGFTHVGEKNYKPRLLHIKGKKKIKVRQVPLSCDSLNEGDVFLLDMGLIIYQFNGKDSGGMERNKGGQLARAIDDDERAGKADVVVLDSSGSAGEGADFEAFFKALGGKTKIKGKDEVPSDEVWEKASGCERKLFKVSDASGKLRFDKVAEGKALSSYKLDSNDVFVLDAGPEVIVWIKKGASDQEKKKGLGLAQDYLDNDPSRPDFLSISKIYEGGENEIFHAYMRM